MKLRGLWAAMAASVVLCALASPAAVYAKESNKKDKAAVTKVSKVNKASKTNKVTKATKSSARKAAAPVARKKVSVKSKPSTSSAKSKQQLVAAKPAASNIIPVQARASYGNKAGLNKASDPLDLRSSVAFVVDQDTHEVLLSKNESAVLPIASITKLMTGVIISEAKLSMDEMVTITEADVDTEKGSSSRLRVGTQLSRGELLHLALMSSENRAAHALGRTFPGGLNHFVQLMNAKAVFLGMQDTRYVEPTGLSSRNQASAKDLATLVSYASADPVLRDFSTSSGYQVEVGNRTLQFNNTNRLVKSPSWDIGLQKTGYIVEAGQCLVMQAKVAGRKLIMVFLDSAGKLSRIADAERVRRWVEAGGARTHNPPVSWNPRLASPSSKG